MIASAFTVRAPWSLAVASGFKDVENRSRQVHHRGPVAIHTAAAWCRLGGNDPRIRSWWWGEQNWRNRPALDGTEFPTAMRRIVAVVNIVGCHRAGPGCCESPWGDQPRLMEPVVWHVELADAMPLDVPVGPVKGSLSLPWQMPDDVAVQVQAQVDRADRDLLAALAAAAELADPSPSGLADRAGVALHRQGGGSGE